MATLGQSRHPTVPSVMMRSSIDHIGFWNFSTNSCTGLGGRIEEKSRVFRAQMDRKLFDALKPRGVLVIADHAAKAGADITVGKSSRHRGMRLVGA
jgi:hypothetical protein